MEPSQRVETRVAVLKLILLGPVLGMFLCCENACTVNAASTKEEFEISGAAGKYNANHAPVISHQGQSQMHQDVVRTLRMGTKYSTFAALLDNMTESVIRPGITVFAPCNQALSDFQKTKAEERLQDVIRFHIITVPMPFSNLLRLEVGSRLTTDVLNRTIQVTNVTASAYEVDDAVIVDPDLYTDATVAVHGINAVFNTSKISEEEPPTVFRSRAPMPFSNLLRFVSNHTIQVTNVTASAVTKWTMQWSSPLTFTRMPPLQYMELMLYSLPRKFLIVLFHSYLFRPFFRRLRLAMLSKFHVK